MQSSVYEFLKPKLVKVERLSPVRSKVTLEPLERGFGHARVRSACAGRIRPGASSAAGTRCAGSASRR